MLSMTNRQPSSNQIDSDTIRAYCETEYRVLYSPPFILRVGQHSADLQRLHDHYKANSSAFITACNPRSEIFQDEINVERQSELTRQLTQSGYPFLQGFGQHPTNQWPAESSWLVLGITLEEASKIAKSYQQNAILFCANDAIPQLILLA
jgi:hypothetical protein